MTEGGIDFGRVLTAMVTPFNADKQVDYEVAEALALHLVEHGTDTLVLCGTTGESPTLSWKEEFELFQVIKKAIAGRAMIVAGTGSNSTREAIEATEKASHLGLDGTLQVVPYYNKPPQEGIYQHFKSVATACPDLAVILYNIPGRTGQNLAPDTVARLAEVPNIVAIKEASGNLDQVSRVRRLTPSSFAIYSGDDSLTLPMLAVGCKGVVSVASHLIGKPLQQMIQAYESGAVVKAAQIHSQYLDLFKTLFIETNPIPVKAALRLQGWSVGETRLPLCAIAPESEHLLKTVMADVQLL
ncbi:MAG: 4-hydroxy-tetrahydrodipicolinate synthase [Elainellaceae cyanobacterium]